MKNSLILCVLIFCSVLFAFLESNAGKSALVYEIYANKTISLLPPPSPNSAVPASTIYLFDGSFTNILDVQDYSILHCPYTDTNELCFILLTYSFGWLQNPNGTPVVYYGAWYIG